MLAAVKKQLDHKKAECESLTYMIKNNIKSDDQAKVAPESQAVNSLKMLQQQKKDNVSLNELGSGLNADRGTEYIQSPQSQNDKLADLPT